MKKRESKYDEHSRHKREKETVSLTCNKNSQLHSETRSRLSRLLPRPGYVLEWDEQRVLGNVPCNGIVAPVNQVPQRQKAIRISPLHVSFYRG